jgi:GT2 family glycosyltransferase
MPNLIKYSSSNNTKIVVADNGSSDDSVVFIKNNYPNIELILLDKNYGFAEGYNRALALVKAEYYIILNSDIEVTENWIPPLIKLLETNPEIAACMPKLRSYYQRDHFEYAGAAGGFIDKYGYPFCKGRIFETLEKDTGQYDGTYPIFWATGACIVIKADIFHQSGGFDPYFFAHQEEIDLCWRLQNLGYKIYCTTDSVVYHLGGGTLPKSNSHKTYLNFRNNMVLLYKNLPREQWVRIVLLRLILDGIAALKFITGPNPGECWAVFNAHMSFYRYLLCKKNHLKTSYEPLQLIHKKSIVYQYYVLKKKFFSDLT